MDTIYIYTQYYIYIDMQSCDWYLLLVYWLWNLKHPQLRQVEVDESWIDAMEEKEAKEKEAPLNARTKREYHGDIHRYIMIYIYT